MDISTKVCALSTYKCYPRVQYFHERLLSLHERFHNIFDVFTSNISRSKKVGEIDQAVETYEKPPRLVVHSNVKLDVSYMVDLVYPLNNPHDKTNGIDIVVIYIEMARADTKGIKLAESVIKTMKTKDKDGRSYNIKNDSGTIMSERVFLWCKVELKSEVELPGLQKGLCSFLRDNFLLDGLCEDQIIISATEIPLKIRISNFLEKSVVTIFEKVQSCLDEFLTSSAYVPLEGEIIEQGAVHESIQAFVCDKWKITDILNYSKTKPDTDKTNTSEMQAEEQYLKYVCEELANVVKCSLSRPLSDKFCLPVSICNDMMMNDSSKQKFIESLSTSTKSFMKRLFSLRENESDYKPPAKTDKHNYMVDRIKKDLSKPLSDIENSMKSIRKETDIMMGKMKFEIRAYLKQSILQQPEVQEKSQDSFLKMKKAVLGLDHVFGCGTVYGQFEIHITQREQGVEEEIKEVIWKHGYSKPYVVKVVEKMPIKFVNIYNEHEKGIGSNERKKGKESGEHENGKESGEHDKGKESGEHSKGKKSGKHEKSKESGEPKRGNKSGEHEKGKKGGEHEKGKESCEHEYMKESGEHENMKEKAKHENGKKSGEHDKSKESGEHENRNENREHENRKESGEHDKEKQGDERDKGKESVEHDKGKESGEHGKGKESGKYEKGKDSGKNKRGKESGEHEKGKKGGEHEKDNENYEHEYRKKSSVHEYREESGENGEYDKGKENGEHGKGKDSGKHEKVKESGEHEDGKENGKYEKRKESGEHNQSKESGEHENRNESSKHDKGKDSDKHESLKDSDKHGKGKESGEHDKGKGSDEHGKGKDSGEHEKGKEVGEHDKGNDSGEHENKNEKREPESRIKNSEHEHEKSKGSGEHEKGKKSGEHEKGNKSGERENESAENERGKESGEYGNGKEIYVLIDNKRRSGTLGGYIEDERGKELFAVTCAHVVRPKNSPDDVEVFVDEREQRRKFGVSTADLTLFPYEGKLIDMAAVKVDDELRNQCCRMLKDESGKHSYSKLVDMTEFERYLGKDVYKYGAKTGLTSGIVCSVDYYLKIREEYGPDKPIVVIDELPGSSKIISADGDSGAYVYQKNSKPLNKFSARGDSGAFVCLKNPKPLYVMDELTESSTKFAFCDESGAPVSLKNPEPFNNHEDRDDSGRTVRLKNLEPEAIKVLSVLIGELETKGDQERYHFSFLLHAGLQEMFKKSKRRLSLCKK